MGTGARQRSDERRWIILGEDGRYITLGRASDPSEQEISETETALLARGLSGWLAVMQGNPYVGAKPRLMQVRALGEAKTAFDDAAHACISAIMAARKATGG
ncbi:hypothetical protein HMPREF0731_3047 [Pseudoroseomonas cervicalis ATCC 49957]|jgi:hypothetical protein|uniref:Uncharacterized protein n=1 Tax=Pseudoroseomonas cervicalis ATCC 49957 TaxID=525371 RepID=D5RPN5_9PROT|nr:hypothetical protein HMPREF0731_3047 [Pseudoroseomonas cervicalis ATCC 49957]